MEHTQAIARREPWNKGKIVGQKAPLKPGAVRNHAGNARRC